MGHESGACALARVEARHPASPPASDWLCLSPYPFPFTYPYAIPASRTLWPRLAMPVNIDLLLVYAYVYRFAVNLYVPSANAG